MSLKCVQIHPEAYLPVSDSSKVGYNIFAMDTQGVHPEQVNNFRTGLKIVLPACTYGILVKPISQDALQIVDSVYIDKRQELVVQLYNFTSDRKFTVERGQRLATLIINQCTLNMHVEWRHDLMVTEFNLTKPVMMVQRMHRRAVIPVRKTESPGYSLVAAQDTALLPHEVTNVRTGIALRLPIGTYGTVALAPHLTFKEGLQVQTTTIMDFGEQEVLIGIYNHRDEPFLIDTSTEFCRLLVTRGVINMEPVLTRQEFAPINLSEVAAETLCEFC
jgi:dUTPase